MDPFRIEKSFRETVQHIDTSASERVQIRYILRFLEEIEPLEGQGDSYAVQLFEKLPGLADPLLVAGMKPGELEHLIRHLEKYRSKCKEAGLLTIRLREYKRALDMLCEWLGEHHVKEDGTGALTAQIGKAKIEYHTGEVLVPVVEQVKQGQKAESIGRLRRLRVDIIGENSVKRHELKPTFGVIGAEAGFFTEPAEASAGRLLRISRNGKEKWWKAAAMFSSSHAWHAGRSANLALAAAFYCEMLKAEEQPEYFRLNPAICLSGDIDNDGNVLPIEEHSLLLKTEAAFFSWVQVMVVPAGQLEYVQHYLEKLNSKYPNRQLAVAGVSNLQDLFYDRRLTIHYKTGAITHSLKRIWKRKYSLAGLAVLITLLLIIARLVYGPVDKNPVGYTLSGIDLEIRNQSGNLITVFPGYGYRIESVEYIRKVLFYDLDQDEKNELILPFTEDGNTLAGKIQAWKIAPNELLWEFDLTKKLDFPKKPDVTEEQFSVGDMEVMLVGKGNSVLAVVGRQIFFPSVIFFIDPATGSELTHYVHVGVLKNIAAADIDNDSEEELLFTGVNNAFKAGIFGVMDFPRAATHSPLQRDYILNDYEEGEKQVYISLPHTMVGEYYSLIQANTYGTDIRINYEEQIIMLEIADVAKSTHRIPLINEDLRYFVFFDFDFNLLNLGTTSVLDNVAARFYQEGKISKVLNYEYLEELKDSVKYWDGNSFTNSKSRLN